MPAFSGYKEYYRMVATIAITEEGMFKNEHIPDDIVSSALYVETVYQIVLTDASGQLIYMEFDNPPAMDEQRQTGGPAVFDGNTLFTDPGPSAVPLELTKKVSNRLPQNWRARADQMGAIAEADGVLSNDDS